MIESCPKVSALRPARLRVQFGLIVSHYAKILRCEFQTIRNERLPECVSVVQTI